MAEAVFSVVLILASLRSVLVVDAVSSSNMVAGVTRAVTSMRPNEAARRGSTVPQTTLPRQQAPTTATVGASRVRILHKRLLAMHFIACIHAVCGVLEYSLPVSDTSCGLAHRSLIATTLLYDAALVLFLLAKTSVTNGNRTLAGWEICITWWSRFYAWFYLPASAFFLATFLPVVANEEGTRCLTGTRQEGENGDFSDTVGYMTNNMMLIVQFVLLLAMFVKPMLLPQGGMQSGGAVYRRVVRRNILCTVCIVFSYTVAAVVVVLALLGSSHAAAQTADSTPALNMVLTLFLTEVGCFMPPRSIVVEYRLCDILTIALPLGFSSCYKSIVASRNPTTTGGQATVRQPNPTLASAKAQAATTTATFPAPTSTATKHQAATTTTAVVPFEEDDAP